MRRCKEKIILASNSPRRSQLLSNSGIEFEQVLPKIEEEKLLNKFGEDPSTLALELARIKAYSVLRGGVGGERSIKNRWVLSADTIVVLGREILGKPKSEDDWRAILKKLSGKVHEVITGWFITNGVIERAGFKVSKVKFRPLNNSEIEWYIKSGEGFDKAGGYAIQGKGLVLVESIEGDLSNVIGLPLPDIIAALRELGVLEDES